MVPSQHYYLFRVLNLQCHQQHRDLDAHRSAVDVVSQKEQMLFGLGLEGGEQTDDFEEVEELSVDVADDDDGFVDRYHVGLIFWMRRKLLTILTKFSTKALTQGLAGFLLSERICFSNVILISFPLPNCSSIR